MNEYWHRFMHWIDTAAPSWIYLLVHALIGITLGLLATTFVAGILIELIVALSWPTWILILAAAGGLVWHFAAGSVAEKRSVTQISFLAANA